MSFNMDRRPPHESQQHYCKVNGTGAEDECPLSRTLRFPVSAERWLHVRSIA